MLYRQLHVPAAGSAQLLTLETADLPVTPLVRPVPYRARLHTPLAHSACRDTLL